MLTDPNVDSPANIDAAVRLFSHCCLAALIQSPIYTYVCICIFLLALLSTIYHLITRFVSNRKCSARTPRSSERWCPGVSKDHRKWRRDMSTNAPQCVLVAVFELLANPVLRKSPQSGCNPALNFCQYSFMLQATSHDSRTATTLSARNCWSSCITCTKNKSHFAFVQSQNNGTKMH